MRITTALTLAVVPVLFSLAPAEAATYTFNRNNLQGNLRTGDHTNITTTYNNNTNLLTWSSTFTKNALTEGNSGDLAEGAWLVLSDGENPKNNVDEYAIFYLDGLTNKVSIYNYDGINSANSYLGGKFLGSTALQVTNSGNSRTFEFAYDATALNNDINGLFGDEWEGATFGDNIGVWFHGASRLQTAYNSDGSLAKFRPGVAGWYDVDNEVATSVPEPGSVAALGLFAVAAATKMRQRLA